MSRIDALKQFLKEDPRDSFSRYALAMEYAKLERYEAAIAEYRTVMEDDPNYAATYYQLGKALEKQNRVDDALEVYRRGISIASLQGDSHTCDELADALEALGGQDGG